jgi:uncharacterized protein
MKMPSTIAAAKPEVFILQDEQGPIVYAPLRNSMARVDDAAASLVLRYLDHSTVDKLADAVANSDTTEYSEDELAVLDILEKHGIFEALPQPQNPSGFMPIEVTLFPTNRCNLRCTYCYADGGDGGHNGEPFITLSLEAGKAAIDLVADNAVALAKKDASIDSFYLSFHGNGEPFSAYPLLRQLVWYAQDVSEQINFPVVINAATNGVLTTEQLDFLIANFNSVNISFDGLPELQNQQRPMANGQGSFAQVDKTLRRLNQSTVNFGIRVTVTAAMVDRLPEIAAFVVANYPNVEQLHLEPVWECGRCLTTTDEAPDPQEFINAYLEALKVAEPADLRLVYSAARQDVICNSFCKVPYGAFTVTPSGDVTACYEVSYKSDPRSERFFFGHFNPNTAGFDIDDSKLADLACLTVQNMPFCQDCFCKWHCGGDCSAKLLENRQPQQHSGSDRCQINRQLTLNQIQRKMRWEE